MGESGDVERTGERRVKSETCVELCMYHDYNWCRRNKRSETRTG